MGKTNNAKTETESEAVEVKIDVSEEDSVIENPKPAYGLVTGCKLLNFRTAPSINSDVIDLLKAGEIVEIIDSDGEFNKVIHAGRTGYAMKKFIEFT